MMLLATEREVNTLAGLLLYPPGTGWDPSHRERVVNYVGSKLELKLGRVVL